MGLWKICAKCEGGLKPYTFRDVIHGIQTCPHCDNFEEVNVENHFEREIAADDLLNRVEAIEAKLGIVPE